MRTLRLALHEDDPEGDRAAIAKAAAILRGGGTVAFPTETVYGLGAHTLNAAAVAKIFVAKGRPAWDPLIVHIADSSQLATVAGNISHPARLWAARFWPGPLTLLVPRAPGVPDAVTAGGARVGVRVPRHPVAQALLQAAGVPVAAPSANCFGHVSPTLAEHVLADLDGRIDAVLDGGPCEHGVESTVVDTTVSPCVVYRPGVVSLQALQEVWPEVAPFQELRSAQQEKGSLLPSPGMDVRHYAPSARLVLVEPGASQAEWLAEAILVALSAGSTGVLLPAGLLSQGSLPEHGAEVFVWGQSSDPESQAKSLYAGLRVLDGLGVETIVCPLPREGGIGDAVRDRLRKAARKR